MGQPIAEPQLRFHQRGQNLTPGEIRSRPIYGGRVASCHRNALVLRKLDEIVQEARFADARLALDEHEPAGSGAGLIEPRPKRALLPVSADHRARIPDLLRR